MAAAWLTAADRDTVTDLWPDASGIMSDTALGIFLSAAAEACEAYAPPIPADGIPDGWLLAQVMQARNTYNALDASPGGDFDGGGYGLTAHPLDWQVQQLLRPKRAVGPIL